MEESAKKILASGILDLFRNGRKNPVCRIFIPGDSRTFMKLPKTLDKCMEQAWKDFLIGQGQGAEMLLYDDWFCRYLQYQPSIQDLYDYALKCEERETDNDGFFEMLTVRAVEYAEKVCKRPCFGRDDVRNNKDDMKFPEMNGYLTQQECRAIEGFYQMGYRVICAVVKEITPKVESQRISRITGSQEEIQTQVLYNLKNEKLDNDEMWWHIRYCIDHGISGCEELMMNLAKNGQWKAWVRQAAAEYACRFGDVGKVCRELLPGLHGKLFYWAVEQFVDTQDDQLKKQLGNYAVYYTGQEMFQDICLVKMQDKSGLKRICSYLERMKRVKKSADVMDPVLAVGEIRSVELLEELDRLTELVMREDFHDRKWNGLQAALVSAFSGIACEGEEEYGQVEAMLDKKVNQYELRVLKRLREKGEENIKTAKEAVRKVDKKLAMLISMAEDIRWRSIHKNMA